MDQFLRDLLTFASTATPATIFALMWFLERRDRVLCQKEQNALIERVVTVAEKYRDLASTFANLLTGTGRT